MAYYLSKLIPPRPEFPADITPEEAQAMHAHIAYWTAQLQAGKVVAFGPVADPAGTWGVGLLSVENEAAADALLAQDPVILAGLGFRSERLFMPQLVKA